VVALTAILSVDILPVEILPGGVGASVGDVARAAVVAPRSADYGSAILTQAARDEATQAVDPKYTYQTEDGDVVSARQVALFDRMLEPVDAILETPCSPRAPAARPLAAALPTISRTALATLQDLDRAAWLALRTEMRARARLGAAARGAGHHARGRPRGPARLLDDAVPGGPARARRRVLGPHCSSPTRPTTAAATETARREAAAGVRSRARLGEAG